MHPSFQIAIDGPVAAGCSTVARLVAERLGMLYIDTGAMYRAATLLATRENVDLEDEAALAKLIKETNIELHRPLDSERDGRLITILLNDEDISWQIRTDEISNQVPIVAKHPQLRKVLVEKQQQIASKDDVVMEGRDITYKVLPNADLKIYLTASDEVRAKRRHMQQQSRGKDISFEEIYRELLRRDKLDMEREVDPLKIVDEALVIDTSDLSIRQAVAVIANKVKAIKKAK